MAVHDHHQRAISRLAETYRDDDRSPGLVFGGSVAKDCAREYSDVDFMIIATDDEFERCVAERDYLINRRDLCDYAGGFVDGKIIDRAFPEQVAEKG